MSRVGDNIDAVLRRWRLATRAGVRGGCCAAGLVLLTLTVSGCRHSRQQASAPPPPPAVSASRSAQSRAATARNGKHGAAVPVSPEAQPTFGFDDTSGKPSLTQFGTASWYGPGFHNRAAADGTTFDQNAMTAAHRTLPMGSTVRVTNVSTGQSALVRITDRGPFAPGRVIDLSLGAAKAVGIWRLGVAQVKLEAFPHPGADPAGHWCVQIGAFQDPANAADAKADMLARFRGAKVIDFAGPTGHWVRINPATPDLAHANQVMKAFASPDAAALPYLIRTN